MKRKFAVFDIDGTLYRYALHHAVIDIIMHSHFTPEINKTIEIQRKNWKTRTHNDVFWDFVDSQNQPFFENLQLIDPKVLEKAAKQVVLEQKNQVYTYTSGLFRQLKAEGRVMIAISGSAEEVVRPFCDYWGFDIVVAQKFERINGKYSGKRQATHDNKDVILNKLIKEHNLTLDSSVSVGDTYFDIPILTMVNEPIAFNPDLKLLRHARDNGWKVVVERKNVIYEMDEKNGLYILE